MLMKMIKVWQNIPNIRPETNPSLNRSGVRGEGAQLSAAFIINT